MAAVDFEEKEFETLVNATLLSGAPAGVQVFSPGQVLEARLGFDFSTRLSPTSKAAQILRKCFPTRSGVSPATAAASGLPLPACGMFLNLFLQYKRPTHFRAGHRSPLWPPDEEFLRFEAMQRKRLGGVSTINFDQVEAMADLESSFGAQAQVRYVCAGFATRDELYAHFAADVLLDNSTFVAPSQLRLGAGFHSYWTYQASNLSYGKPNPDGARESTSNGRDFFTELSDAGIVESSLEEFADRYFRLALETTTRESWSRRRGRERPFLELIEEQRRAMAIEVNRVCEPRDAEHVLQTIQTGTVARTLDLEWMVVKI